MRAYPTHRLNALIDAVAAVAMTILVLDIRLPESTAADTLPSDLLDLLPRLELWLTSFLVVSVLWFVHHQVLGRQEVMDKPSMALGLLFAAGLSLLPFSITVAARVPDLPLSLQWFWATAGLTAGALALQLVLVLRLRSAHPDFADPTERRRQLIAVGILPVVAALCLLLAPLHTRASLYAWLAVAASLVLVRGETAKSAPAGGAQHDGVGCDLRVGGEVAGSADALEEVECDL